jgi:hypothetical protein
MNQQLPPDEPKYIQPSGGSQSMSPSDLSRSNQILFTVITAVILLGVVGLGYRLITGGNGAQETPPTAISTEEWPATPTLLPVTPTNPPSPTPTPTSTPTPIPPPTPIVIGWRELGTLVSIETTMQTVAETTRRTGPGGIFEESVLLVATGNVEAGVDLTKLDEETDVIIDGKSIKIALPPAEITSVEILPSETQIYDSGGFLGLPAGEGLEVQAIDQARTDMEKWATEKGDILDMAERMAKSQLEAFLRKLGFEEVEITFKQSS